MYYDIGSEKWVGLSETKVIRSQSAACRINDNEIVLFGGYNKEKGTLDTIERYLINENK
jgi:N-acetylneuraminic acid mutarotase